jgi:kynureninase
MNTLSFEPGEEYALSMDAQDPLARFRDCFHVPGRIYIDGNSRA